MYDEPADDDEQGGGGGKKPKPDGRPRDPAAAAREQADGLYMHAQIAAVFEGPRKADAAIVPGLDPDLAREVQRTVGKLGNVIAKGGPLLTGPAATDAATVLSVPDDRGLSTNDYHVHRRPGETMVVRWLAGAEQVDYFYTRLQAHFDAGLEAHKEDERQAHGWKQDPAAAAYLAALDGVNADLAERYHRNAVRVGRATVLSTLAADEMNIAHLCDHVMGVPAAEVVGRASAPPLDREPTDAERAWYFKLFALRGPARPAGGERLCFFTYLQKAAADDDW